MNLFKNDKPCSCKECKCSKFVPVTTPRYGKYEVHETIWQNDLNQYNKHLKRIFNALPLVDAKPPAYHLRTRLAVMDLCTDAYRARQVDLENKRLIQALIAVERLGGKVDTVNKFCCRCASRWRTEKLKLEKIDNQNKIFYNQLKKMETTYGFNKKDWKRQKELLKECSRFPLIIFNKRNLDKEARAMPSISSGLSEYKKCKHLECFIEFTVEDGEFLGTIFIELYHDCVPVTVENFLEICKGNNKLTYQFCPVHRIVRNQFMECGDIVNGTGTGGFSIYGKNFDEESHTLKHTKPGTVSMVREAKQKNSSKFCITFKSMESLDRKNVVFGKVVKGIDVLMKINNYSRNIGKPLKKIYISNCGDLPPCVCANSCFA